MVGKGKGLDESFYLDVCSFLLVLENLQEWVTPFETSDFKWDKGDFGSNFAKSFLLPPPPTIKKTISALVCQKMKKGLPLALLGLRKQALMLEAI